ncbi:MAG: T9SS type A sorting domain-containing protein [bacterium]
MKRLFFFLILAHISFSANIKIKPGDIFIKKGERFTLEIFAEEFSGLTGAQLNLFYDSTKLGFEIATAGSLFDDIGDFFLPPDDDKQRVLIAAAKDYGNIENGSGTIALIRFLSLSEGWNGSLTLSDIILTGTPSDIPVETITNAYIHSIPTTAFDNINVYPNPWRSDKEINPWIVFETPDGSDIFIYTISGRLIREFRDVRSPTKWMLDNQFNKPISSGMYIYQIKDRDGRKTMGKIGIAK